jgi:hypothetical protein
VSVLVGKSLAPQIGHLVLYIRLPEPVTVTTYTGRVDPISGGRRIRKKSYAKGPPG